MSVSEITRREREDDREQTLQRVRVLAARKIAVTLCVALDAAAKHMQAMRRAFAHEYGTDILHAAKSAESEAIVTQIFDNAFGVDAVNSMPLDYQGAVDSSGGELLCGDDEIVVDALRSHIRSELMGQAGTN